MVLVSSRNSQLPFPREISRTLEVGVVTDRWHVEQQILQRLSVSLRSQDFAKDLPMLRLGGPAIPGRPHPQRPDQLVIDMPHNQLAHLSTPFLATIIAMMIAMITAEIGSTDRA
jgi:hypothetical protein